MKKTYKLICPTCKKHHFEELDENETQNIQYRPRRCPLPLCKKRQVLTKGWSIKW